MNFAVLAVFVVTVAVTATLASFWRKRVLNRGTSVLEESSAGMVALSSASIAAVAQLVWIALFIWAPPISNGQHRELYILMSVVGMICSVVAFAGGLVGRKRPEGKWVALSGLILGLWLLAAAASMPVS